MKYYYFVFVFLCTLFSSFAQVTKSVYFLGNSYTDYNNLPNLIEQVAASTQDVLLYQAFAPGGQALEDHSKNQNVLNTITANTWDYVVLQEQSQRPTFGDSYTFPFAKKLSDLIKKSNPCAKTMFYMTWGYKNGDEVNCKNGLTYVCTFEGMDDKIYDSYMRMGKANLGVVSPVGKVRREIRKRFPQMELYDADNSHPSYLGSMVAAYTFYTSIFKKDPTQILFNGNLSATDADLIKAIVKEIVFDDMKKWDFTVNTTNVKFTVDQTDSPTFTFTNTSVNGTNVEWDFGDGTTSTDTNPTHTYTKSGTYTVRLTVVYCGDSYEYTEDILAIIEEEVEEENAEETGGTVVPPKDNNSSMLFTIYPNPTTTNLYVYTEGLESVYVFDMAGKRYDVKMKYQPENYKVDVRYLATGIYWLQANSKEGTKYFKFVKK